MTITVTTTPSGRRWGWGEGVAAIKPPSGRCPGGAGRVDVGSG